MGPAPGVLPPLYGRLDTSRKEIRLVEIQCGQYNDKDAVQCKLVKSTVQNGLPYEALSYVWGSPGDRVPLSINGHTLWITKNLDTALRNLRQLTTYRSTVDVSTDPASVSLDREIQRQAAMPDPLRSGNSVSGQVVRRIWIDAICINQDDIKERNEQVKLMFDLYSHAARVILWFGEEKDDSDLAMDLFCQLQVHGLSSVAQRYPQASFTPWERAQMTKWSSREPWYYSLMKLHGSSGGEHINPQDPKEWVAFQRFMEREWWQRMWVVQELIAGHRRAVVGCGSKWVPWSCLAVSNGAILQSKSNPMMAPLRRLAANSDRISELDAISLRTEAGILKGLGGIMFVIGYTLSKKATQPVDRIYALLGFYANMPLVPDYAKTPEEVYRSFVRDTIQATNDLGILSFNRFPKNLDLPSWLPDFSCDFKDDEYNVTIPRGLFGADGNPSRNSVAGSPAVSLAQTDGPDELRVIGLAYDQPVYVAPPWQAPAEERDELLWKLTKEYEAKVKTLEGKFTKEHLHDALWRTLAWNATPESTYPAPNEYGREYVHVTDPKDTLTDVNKMMAGIHDASEHKRIIPVLGLARTYYESVVKHSLNRRFFITSKGNLGSGPIEMRTTDLVCVLNGFKTPVILRKRASGDTFQWIGPAYVHGIMQGESLKESNRVVALFKLK